MFGGGLLLNSIRSMFGEHAGLGGNERGELGSSGGRAADNYLAHRIAIKIRTKTRTTTTKH